MQLLFGRISGRHALGEILIADSVLLVREGLWGGDKISAVIHF
jgi:hypothetical protein